MIKIGLGYRISQFSDYDFSRVSQYTMGNHQQINEINLVLPLIKYEIILFEDPNETSCPNGTEWLDEIL